MSHKEIVAHDPALARAIALCALAAITRAARGKLTHVVSKDAATPRLIERNPMLYLRAKRPKDNTSIVCKISNKLVFVQKTTVALIQFIREIPVEEGDERRDACSQ